jgi:hypothetical protein
MTQFALVRFNPMLPHLVLISITLGPPTLQNMMSAASRDLLRIFPSHCRFWIPYHTNSISNKSSIDIPVLHIMISTYLLGLKGLGGCLHWEYTIVLSLTFLVIWSCWIRASIFTLGSMLPAAGFPATADLTHTLVCHDNVRDLLLGEYLRGRHVVWCDTREDLSVFVLYGPAIPSHDAGTLPK